MPWFKTFLSLLIILTTLVFFCGCGLFAEKPGAAEPFGENSELPEWLKLSHRRAGPLNFDYVPLDPDEIKVTAGEEDGIDEQEAASGGAGSSYRPNPTGSPYAPGTLDDMIWQQKQRDKQ